MASTSPQVSSSQNDEPLVSVRRRVPRAFKDAQGPLQTNAALNVPNAEPVQHFEVSGNINVAKEDANSLPSIQLIQRWEGVVDDSNASEFAATLVDTTTPANARERAVFSLGEVSDEDRELIRPGAVFYWWIGVQRSSGGQLTHFWRLRFRRIPRWTREETRKHEAKASKFRALMNGSK